MKSDIFHSTFYFILSFMTKHLFFFLFTFPPKKLSTKLWITWINQCITWFLCNFFHFSSTFLWITFCITVNNFFHFFNISCFFAFFCLFYIDMIFFLIFIIVYKFKIFSQFSNYLKSSKTFFTASLFLIQILYS